MVIFCKRAYQVALEVKKPPAYAGDSRDTNSIPGSGRSPGGGHGNPLQYSCLENPMARGAAVPSVTQSWTPLKWLDTHILRRRRTRICMVLCFTGKKKPGLLFISTCFLGHEGLTTCGHKPSTEAADPFHPGPHMANTGLGVCVFNTTLSSREFGTHVFLLTPTSPWDLPARKTILEEVWRGWGSCFCNCLRLRKHRSPQVSPSALTLT